MDSNRQEPVVDSRGNAVRLRGKRPYATPTLTEYGSVAKLTQSGAGTTNDGSGRKLKRTCL